MRPLVTVFGGSGFVGRAIVAQLLGAGWSVRVVSRNPERIKSVLPSGAVGQLSVCYGSVLSDADVARSVAGSQAVINAVGILFEKQKQRFPAIHAQAAERVAKFAHAAGATTLVHISALGVDRNSKSRYARTKMTGEKAVSSAFPNAIILRPGLIFGPGDGFFPLFAQMLRFVPLVVLIGGGKTRFQPVYVGDVAKAVLKILTNEKNISNCYELTGKKTYSFEEMLRYLAALLKRKALFISLPFMLAEIFATLVSILPKPFLTRDQIALLKGDNCSNGLLPGLEALGITPTTLEEILPSYISAFARD